MIFSQTQKSSKIKIKKNTLKNWLSFLNRYRQKSFYKFQFWWSKNKQKKIFAIKIKKQKKYIRTKSFRAKNRYLKRWTFKKTIPLTAFDKSIWFAQDLWNPRNLSNQSLIQRPHYLYKGWWKDSPILWAKMGAYWHGQIPLSDKYRKEEKINVPIVYPILFRGSRLYTISRILKGSHYFNNYRNLYKFFFLHQHYINFLYANSIDQYISLYKWPKIKFNLLIKKKKKFANKVAWQQLKKQQQRLKFLQPLQTYGAKKKQKNFSLRYTFSRTKKFTYPFTIQSHYYRSLLIKRSHKKINEQILITPIKLNKLSLFESRRLKKIEHVKLLCKKIIRKCQNDKMARRRQFFFYFKGKAEFKKQRKLSSFNFKRDVLNFRLPHKLYLFFNKMYPFIQLLTWHSLQLQQNKTIKTYKPWLIYTKVFPFNFLKIKQEDDDKNIFSFEFENIVKYFDFWLKRYCWAYWFFFRRIKSFHQLTNYYTQVSPKKNPLQQFQLKLTNTLSYVLYYLGFTPSIKISKKIIEKGWVLVNYKLCYQVNRSIKPGDIISLNFFSIIRASLARKRRQLNWGGFSNNRLVRNESTKFLLRMKLWENRQNLWTNLSVFFFIQVQKFIKSHFSTEFYKTWFVYTRRFRPYSARYIRYVMSHRPYILTIQKNDYQINWRTGSAICLSHWKRDKFSNVNTEKENNIILTWLFNKKKITRF